MPMTYRLSEMRAGGKSGDREVRAALLADLKRGSAPRGHRILQEFWVPLSHERADVVDVNGLLCAYEIKSARDDLSRLSRQVAAFNCIFDRVTMVMASCHVHQSEDLIPRWWGMIEVRHRGQTLELRQLRNPRHNPFVDPGMQVRLLWRRELIPVLRELGVLAPDRLGRPHMWAELQARASRRHLQTIVRSSLLARDPVTRRW